MRQRPFYVVEFCAHQEILANGVVVVSHELVFHAEFETMIYETSF